MNLEDLDRAIPAFARLPHAELIKAFAWHLHTHKKVERVTQADIRACYDRLHLAKPSNVSPYFQQLQNKKPPELLKDSRGYSLEGRVRESFDSKYGTRPLTI